MHWFLLVPAGLLYLQACRHALWTLNHPRADLDGPEGVKLGERYHDNSGVPLLLLPLVILLIATVALFWELPLMAYWTFLHRPLSALWGIDMNRAMDALSATPARERQWERERERKRLQSRAQELERELLDKP